MRSERTWRSICIALLASAALLESCGTTVWQMKASECTSSNDDVFKSLTGLMLEKNFQIKMNDAKIGYLIAETEPVRSIWSGMVEKRVWQFQINGNKITGTAKVVSNATNVFGTVTSSSETYYNDDCSSSWDWYWDVRNGVQKLCGRVVFSEKNTN